MVVQAIRILETTSATSTLRTCAHGFRGHVESLVTLACPTTAYSCLPNCLLSLWEVRAHYQRLPCQVEGLAGIAISQPYLGTTHLVATAAYVCSYIYAANVILATSELKSIYLYGYSGIVVVRTLIAIVNTVTKLYAHGWILVSIDPTLVDVAITTTSNFK